MFSLALPSSLLKFSGVICQQGGDQIWNVTKTENMCIGYWLFSEQESGTLVNILSFLFLFLLRVRDGPRQRETFRPYISPVNIN